MPRTKGKAERLNCRISPALKEQVETAARLCGQSITAFTEMALTEKSQEVLKHEERIQLSQSAFEAFLEVLEAPPAPPSSKLLAALEDYKRQRSS